MGWKGAEPETSKSLEQVLWWAVSWLNADVEKRREEREEKQAVSLQPG